jgi:hypothetical protein
MLVNREDLYLEKQANFGVAAASIQDGVPSAMEVEVS